VRSLLIPLSVQQSLSTEKTKALKPYQAKIKERFESDKESQNKALAKLFEDSGTNPLAGCFTSLASLPVFLGLYRGVTALAKTGEIDEPFLWLPTLQGPVSAPDFRGIDWLTANWVDGHPSMGWAATASFLVMPVLLVALQSLTLKILSPPPDPETSSEEEIEAYEKSAVILKILPFSVRSPPPPAPNGFASGKSGGDPPNPPRGRRGRGGGGSGGSAEAGRAREREAPSAAEADRVRAVGGRPPEPPPRPAGARKRGERGSARLFPRRKRFASGLGLPPNPPRGRRRRTLRARGAKCLTPPPPHPPPPPPPPPSQIGWFSMQTPAGLTFYWASSNLFTLFQSLAVRQYYKLNPIKVELPEYWQDLDNDEKANDPELAKQGLAKGPSMIELLDEARAHVVIERASTREGSEAWGRVTAAGRKAEVAPALQGWVDDA
jgi:YidC/Oxa1 family membrane protein insertase